MVPVETAKRNSRDSNLSQVSEQPVSYIRFEWVYHLRLLVFRAVLFTAKIPAELPLRGRCADKFQDQESRNVEEVN
ncbi:hypothetical protein OUZ56_001503 [Daphnia magna]|uniref:Uncharacterized protein n=1 Tax=Daphnia magna TaxID=35525 RepID=A0ABR0A2W0_9CRUS|nr:hypothetical protein OUZ56_001503 [Daphnia magna]